MRCLAWLRAWADAELTAGPHPIVAMVAGGGLNLLGVAIGAPWWARLAAVLALGYVGRFTPLLGRKMAEWHLEIAWGAGVAELATWFLLCRGPCG